MKRPLLLLAGSVLLLAACASFTERTQQLSLGMTPAQVKEALGGNYTVMASRYGSDGRPVEFWQFKNPDSGKTFSVYFKNDKLVQWGSPDSLKDISELNLNTPESGGRTNQPAAE